MMKRLFQGIKNKIKAFLITCFQEALSTQTDSINEISVRLMALEEQIEKDETISSKRFNQLIDISNQSTIAVVSHKAFFKNELNDYYIKLVEEIRSKNYVLAESLHELSQQMIKDSDEWHACAELRKVTDASFQEKMNSIHERVDSVIQGILDMNKNVSDFETYYRARESDMQNCVDYIQQRVDYAIQCQLNIRKTISNEIDPILFTIFSFVQNAAIPVEETHTSDTYLYIQELHKLTEVYEVSGISNVIRIGKGDDGGYIMFEPLSTKKIAYSIGISDDVSWDLGMAVRGYQVFQYDHTIEALPEDNASFHWKKIGLGSVDRDDVRSLESILFENGHLGISGMVLKMDIEGAEWEVINSCPEELFKMFDQIVLELHDLGNTRKCEEILSALRILNKTHFVAHIHGNNYSAAKFCGDLMVPYTLEVTYLNRDRYRHNGKSKKYLPLLIDAPNRAVAPDIQLGRW